MQPPDDFTWLEKFGAWFAALIAGGLGLAKLQARWRERLATRLDAKADRSLMDTAHAAIREDVAHHHAAILDLFGKNDERRDQIEALRMQMMGGFAELRESLHEIHTEMLRLGGK